MSEPPTENLLTTSKRPSETELRADGPALDPGSLWNAISMTPGVGVSVTDRDGKLIFVNETTQLLFSESPMVSYHGKSIADFHPPEFVAERLEVIRRVLAERKPLAMTHILHGRRIYSTVWPIADHRPPYGRVVVISRERAPHEAASCLEEEVPCIASAYIDLGELDVLSPRELEVLVMLGHGLTVPEVAARLFRSPKTVERHKASIASKLGTHRQSDLVAIVTSIGLELDDLKLKRLETLQ